MEDLKKEQRQLDDYEEHYAKAFKDPKQWPLTIADMLRDEQACDYSPPDDQTGRLSREEFLGEGN